MWYGRHSFSLGVVNNLKKDKGDSLVINIVVGIYLSE